MSIYRRGDYDNKKEERNSPKYLPAILLEASLSMWLLLMLHAEICLLSRKHLHQENYKKADGPQAFKACR